MTKYMALQQNYAALRSAYADPNGLVADPALWERLTVEPH